MGKHSADVVVADLDRAEFMALVAKANSGDPAALAQLRSTLANNPSIAERLGDLVAIAERSLCAEVVRNDPAMAEIIAEKVRQQRKELLAGSTSTVVRFSVDRVVLTWLAVYLLDLRYVDVSQMPPPEANLVIKEKAAAERRHQAALRTLATVRRLTELAPAGTKQKWSGRQSDTPVLDVVG